MSPEAQRIAIAEACGWTDIKQGPYDGSPFGRHKSHNLEMVPDYLNDLNAMHEAEKVLTGNCKFSYLCELERVLGFSSGPGGWDMETDGLWAVVNATPAQRAEAFLRTIGKWKD